MRDELQSEQIVMQFSLAPQTKAKYIYLLMNRPQEASVLITLLSCLSVNNTQADGVAKHSSEASKTQSENTSMLFAHVLNKL